MDLAVYISELLRQQGMLSVPGLGKFSQVSQQGYYAEDEGRFYPPYYETGFTEQVTEDDTFASYLSSKKNISINSAKYFIEKYVNQLKQQSAAGEAPVDQLGWMSYTGNALHFRPNAAASTYEGDFFGLPTIQVGKIWEQLSGFKPLVSVPASEPAIPVAAEPTPLTTPMPVTTPTPELSIFPEVLTLKPEPQAPSIPPKREREPLKPATTTTPPAPEVQKTSVNIWILVLVIITVAAIILLTLYNYKPNLFSTRGTGNVHAPATVKSPVANKTVTPKKDSIQTSLSSTADTSTKAKISTTDTTVAKQPAAVPTPVADAEPDNTDAEKYQIAGGAFSSAKEAEQSIAAYRSLGVAARVLYPNRAGNKIKLTLGSFDTYEQADARLQELKAAHKVMKDAYIIRPKAK